MAARIFARSRSKFLVLGTVLGGGAAAVASTDDPSTTLKICTAVPVRLIRDAFTAATIAFDYEYSLRGLPQGSIERARAKHEVHTRSANKLQELCFRNGGLYIKLGQHIGQLEYLVPEEYVQIMRASMLNRCPVSSYDQVCKVFKNELGRLPDEIFVEFDPVPLASASLAQVHAARTHDGKKVAVKVQHTHLTDTALADAATVGFLVNVLHWCFPAFDYRWLIDEIRESAPKVFSDTSRTLLRYVSSPSIERREKHLYSGFPDRSNARLLCSAERRLIVASSGLSLAVPLYRGAFTSELDFLYEAKNSEKCLDNFKRFSPHLLDYIYAPKVYWNLSTSKLLTMEFMDAPEITDVDTIRRLGLRPNEVAKLVSQAFAEMMFKHGFVHCDPHAANLLVRPAPSGKRSILGKRKPQLILLDHGLYKTLDFPTRTNYASLWKALIFADEKGIKENSVKLGAGEDLYALFAGILTMKPWNRVIDPAVDHLLLQGSDSDRTELQMYASQYFLQISELLKRLPRVILLMLKTNDCLRAVNHSLVSLYHFQRRQMEAAGQIGGYYGLAPSRICDKWGSSIDTFLIIGRVSSEAVAELKRLQKKSLWSGLGILLDEILLEVRLLGMQVAAWLLQFRRALSG